MGIRPYFRSFHSFVFTRSLVIFALHFQRQKVVMIGFVTQTFFKSIDFVVGAMTGLLFRAFGKAMDSYTAIRYGKESASNAASLKELVDRDIFGNEVKV
jgi:hypothetical protein